MAQVNMSMDTNTRQCVLVIDGQVVPCESAQMAKYMDYDGNPQVAFEYEQRSQAGNGMMEMHRYRMPTPDEMNSGGSMAGLNQAGLFESTVADTAKATKDIADFFKRDRT